MNFLDFIKARLKEKSTWAGILTILTSVGVFAALDAETAAAISGGLAALAGVILAAINTTDPTPPAA